MVYECERRLQVEAPAEEVWDWMSDVRRLLSLNPFHVCVHSAGPVNNRSAGTGRHNVFGLYVRIAAFASTAHFTGMGRAPGKWQRLVSAQPVGRTG